jgi:NADPH:quinone reductase-like Zn-dependent oxidoreductase
MRAIVVQRTGPPEVLTLEEVPDPTPGDREALIRVNVAGINRYDVLRRAGVYPGPTPFIPGADAVGIRADTGERVLITGVGGCYAELVTCPIEKIWALPESIDDMTAVALGVPYRTAWSAIVDAGKLERGQVLLVQAGGSATGQAAIDIGVHLGARVYATGSRPKLDRIGSLGAQALPYNDPELAEIGAHVVFEPLGAETLASSVSALAKNGVVVVTGSLTGTQGTFDIPTLLRTGGRIQAASATDNPETMDHILELAARGKLRPAIDRELPLEDAAAAHQALEQRENFGKLILRVRG